MPSRNGKLSPKSCVTATTESGYRDKWHSLPGTVACCVPYSEPHKLTYKPCRHKNAINENVVSCDQCDKKIEIRV
jgi:hypothetical protein